MGRVSGVFSPKTDVVQVVDVDLDLLLDCSALLCYETGIQLLESEVAMLTKMI
jgi:hypothetical protein